MKQAQRKTVLRKRACIALLAGVTVLAAPALAVATGIGGEGGGGWHGYSGGLDGFDKGDKVKKDKKKRFKRIAVCVKDCEKPPEEVPEPATLVLLGSGLAGLALRARRKKPEA